MELTINTTLKRIHFKGVISIKDLLDELMRLHIVPEEWEIEGETIKFEFPLQPYIPDSIPWIQPYNPCPPLYPTITCSTNDKVIVRTTGWH